MSIRRSHILAALVCYGVACALVALIVGRPSAANGQTNAQTALGVKLGNGIVERAAGIYEMLDIFAPGVDRKKFMRLWLAIEFKRAYKRTGGPIPEPELLADTIDQIIDGLNPPVIDDTPAAARNCLECGLPLPANGVCPICHPGEAKGPPT